MTTNDAAIATGADSGFLMKIIIAGLIGSAIFIAIGVGAPVFITYAFTVWIPAALYTLPIAIALLLTQRIGWRGLFALTFGVALSCAIAEAVTNQAFGAFGAGAYTKIPATPQDVAEFAKSAGFIGGGLGGFFGSLLSFLVIMSLRRGVEGRLKPMEYGLYIAILTVIGAATYGVAYESADGGSLKIAYLLFPWQLIFTIAIARAFQSRRPA